MSRRLWIAAILLALTLTGCTRDVRDPDTHAQGLKPSPGQSASEAENPMERIRQEGPRAHGTEDLDYLKANLKPGMTQEEVAKLFGDGYRIVVHPEGGTRMWRYDFAEPSYQFQPTGTTVGTNTAQADIDGLRKGMVQYQMFVGWDPVDRFTTYSELYYFKDLGGRHQVHVFTVYPDGSTTDSEIPAV